VVEIEKDRIEFMSECRQAHSRIEESQIRPMFAQNDEKMHFLELSNKRMSDGLTRLLTHVQENFLTK
jgi:hypothetical protein